MKIRMLPLVVVLGVSTGWQGGNLASVQAAERSEVGKVVIESARFTNRFRPLHGINCGPLIGGGVVDLSEGHRELALPFTRLHDCNWPNPDVVDIHAVFPDFEADATRPENYDFRRTDEYLQSIVNVGSRIVYRLGESIEHTKTKYHVHPPSSAEQWARICLGIIRHYNEGWANGFRHRIEYWEIWNEPENRPAMWTGTDEQYFELYAITAKAIRQEFPRLKVGGPSLGHTGNLVEGRFQPSSFLTSFLRYCREHNLPLDFFSWHLYSATPGECVIRAAALRRLLDEMDFPNAELHFNEWNYLPANDWSPMLRAGQGVPREKFYAAIGGMPGAAFSANVLLLLQDSPVDVANYYSGNTQGFGLFTVDGVPRKNFHAFKAFARLLQTPLRVATRGDAGLVHGAGWNAARNELGLLVSNFDGPHRRVEVEVRDLPFEGLVQCEIFLIDQTHDLSLSRRLDLAPDQVRFGQEMAAPAVCFVRLRGQAIRDQ